MPPANADVPEAATRERSPFPAPQQQVRLNTLLDAYAAGDAGWRYSNQAAIDTTMRRLEAIADWTQKHSEKTRITSLADNSRMYRAHARWLAGWR